MRLLSELIAEKLMDVFYSDDGKRQADMYLPKGLFYVACFLLLGGLGFVVASFFVRSIWMILAAALVLTLGIAAGLCWKNQTIRMLNDEVFEYTTWLGNTSEYRFKDITGLRRNSDSVTLFVGEKKVHIEAMAITSDRLNNRVEKEMQKKR